MTQWNQCFIRATSQPVMTVLNFKLHMGWLCNAKEIINKISAWPDCWFTSHIYSITIAGPPHWLVQICLNHCFQPPRPTATVTTPARVFDSTARKSAPRAPARWSCRNATPWDTFRTRFGHTLRVADLMEWSDVNPEGGKRRESILYDFSLSSKVITYILKLSQL